MNTSINFMRWWTVIVSRDTAGLTLKLRRGAQDSRIHIVLNEDKQDHQNEEDHPNNSRGNGYEKEPGEKPKIPIWTFSHCQTSLKKQKYANAASTFMLSNGTSAHQ